jgi:hypothetical protein
MWRMSQGNPAHPPGIEGLKIGKVYYNLMRNLATVLVLLAGAILTGSLAAGHQQTSLKTASLESHEGLTITAQPWTDAAVYKPKFPKKSPFAAGIVAIQVAFRNDSDESVKINIERIRLNVSLSEEDRQGLQALNPEGVAEVVMNPKAKDPSRKVHIPLPVGGSSSPKDKHWLEIEKAARDAGVPGSVVAPHKTMEGLLYFDLQGQLDLLGSAHLYFPDVTALEKNRPLLYFDIDLSRSASR